MSVIQMVAPSVVWSVVRTELVMDPLMVDSRALELDISTVVKLVALKACS